MRNTYKTNKNALSGGALLLFEFQLPPSQHLTSIVQVAGLKRVPKYKWPRTETIVVTQEAT